MVLAVHLNLDQAASDRVREIWWALATAGINDCMLAAEDVPHLSLAIYADADLDALTAAIDAFAARAAPLPVTFSSLGLFPGAAGVLFLAPKPSGTLLRLHELFHHFAAAMRTACSPHYLPENWVPHCTLGMPMPPVDIARALRGLDALGTAWQPLPAILTTVQLVRGPPVRSIHSRALGR